MQKSNTSKDCSQGCTDSESARAFILNRSNSWRQIQFFVAKNLCYHQNYTKAEFSTILSSLIRKLRKSYFSSIFMKNPKIQAKNLRFSHIIILELNFRHKILFTKIFDLSPKLSHHQHSSRCVGYCVGENGCKKYYQ